MRYRQQLNLLHLPHLQLPHLQLPHLVEIFTVIELVLTLSLQ